MSTKYNHSYEVPTAVLAKRLEELSDSICKQGEERDRELSLHIPAEVDRDADLVLCEAAQRLVKLEAERDAAIAKGKDAFDAMHREEPVAWLVIGDPFDGTEGLEAGDWDIDPVTGLLDQISVENSPARIGLYTAPIAQTTPQPAEHEAMVQELTWAKACADHWQANAGHWCRAWHELRGERDALVGNVRRLRHFRSAACGWIENDWPEGFCRRTAELVADHGRQAEESQ